MLNIEGYLLDKQNSASLGTSGEAWSACGGDGYRPGPRSWGPHWGVRLIYIYVKRAQFIRRINKYRRIYVSSENPVNKMQKQKLEIQKGFAFTLFKSEKYKIVLLD